MVKSEIKCAHCGKISAKENGAIARAIKNNQSLYCDRMCAGIGRRKHKTEAQLKEEKRLYDAEYRRKNRDVLKKKKREYFQKTYDPIAAKQHRKRRMAYHIEYCRQPEYKEKKHKYDRERYAKQTFGPLWEIHVTLMELSEAIAERADKYEIYRENGTLNKAQNRRRDYERLNSNKSEECSLGNINRCKNW